MAKQRRGHRTASDPGPAHPPVNLWRPRRLPGVELMSAHYRSRSFRPHVHAVYSVCVVQEGVAELGVGGRPRRVPAGGFALLEPGEVHTGGNASAEVVYRNVSLPRPLAEELLGLAPHEALSVAFARHLPRDAELARHFSQAHARLEARPSEAAEAELRDALSDVFRRYAVAVPRAAAARRERAAVRRATDLIEREVHRNVRLDELADSAGLSRYHLLRVFRDDTGLTPHAYLLQHRIEQARSRLRAGEPIAAVAQALGFSDQSHFGSFFKAIVGVTPGQYARSLGPGAIPA